MKSLFAAIALVAACSVANAAEVKKDTKAPVVAGKTMTDQDMDKVTAGRAFVLERGPGAVIELPGRASDTAYGGGINSANYHAGTHPAHLCGNGC